MQPQSKHQPAGWIPLAAGLGWLVAGAEASVVTLFVTLVPGVPLLSTGGAKLLWPGDPRIQQFAALGGVLGVVTAVPAIFLLGLFPALALAALSAASFVAAGHVSVAQARHPEGVPDPRPGLALSAKVAIDEALLSTMLVGMAIPRGDETTAIRREVEAARDFFQAQGWLEKPLKYHATPPALEAPKLRDREVRLRGGRTRYEHLSFESGYEPHADEPGRDRWLSYARNRTAHAWVVRRPGNEARPWVVCIHGYQMGSPMIDIGAFDPRFIVEKLGLNAIFPVLPLHGPRKQGRRSGDRFISGDVIDSVHAEAQAMWDIRRLISWVRAQGAPAVGVHGLSLGGYNAALLASTEPGLACAIAGIPATDFARLLWLHSPPLQIKYMEHRGVVHDEVAEVLRVVSPLALDPLVPKRGRAIYGGVADRLVPPDQVRDLWRHWEEPEAMIWYQGAHITFQLDPRVRHMVEAVLVQNLLADEAVQAT